jgi:hypothetical protein
VGAILGSVTHPDPGPETILNKAAYEQAVADGLAARLKAWQSNKGDYVITLVGCYLDTKLNVSGRKIRTGEPIQWEFARWEIWQDWGNVNGTTTVIYGNMD